MKHRSKRMAGVAAAMMIASGASVAVAVGWSGGSTPNVHPAASGAGAVAPVGDEVMPVSVNANGQTYGSAVGASSSAGLPDLIRVRATNGVFGYITKVAYLGPALPTPTQVKSYPKNTQGDYVAPSRSVPVYTSNGTSQVGVFTFGGGTYQTNR